MASGSGNGEFYGRRAARILPLHLITTLAAVVITALSGGVNWLTSFLALFLVQAWMPEDLRYGGNGPSWSLSVEAFFYACFPFIIRHLTGASIRRCKMVVTGVVVLMILWTAVFSGASYLSLPGISPFTMYTNPLYRLGEFVIGICLSTAIRNGWRIRLSLRQGAWLALGGFLALAGLNWVVEVAKIKLGATAGIPLGMLDLMYLPFSVVVIAAAARNDVELRGSIFSGKWNVRLGQWSFALYLIQMLVIGPVSALIPFNTVSWLGAALFVLTLVGCIALSAVMYHWFERPLESLLTARLRKTRPEPVRDVPQESLTGSGRHRA